MGKIDINPRKIVAVIFAGMLLWSYSRAEKDGDVEFISINPHQAKEYLNLSEIADSVKCIKLQTAPGDVVGRTVQIIIKKKYIYAFDADQRMIFVFDKEGKFVSKLAKRGQGPDEYLIITGLFVDDNEEYVEIKTHKKIMKYKNISFELVESSPFPIVSCNDICRKDGYYYCSTDQIDNTVDGKKTNAGLLIIDSNNKIKRLFDKNIETNNYYYAVNEGSFTQSNRNELFMSVMFDNTFYRIDGEKAHPVYTVDFGKYGMNNKMGLRSTQEQLSYIHEINGLASFPLLNLNNDNIMSFSYYLKNSSDVQWPNRKEYFRQFIRLKNTNKTYHVKSIKNDISSFPENIYLSLCLFGCAHEVWHDDYLVDIVFPAKYFSNDEDEIFVEGIGKITAYDDPIIVLMKLKPELR